MPTLAVLLLLMGLTLAMPVTAGQQNTLNFKAADINAVISAVAEVTGKNFIVDPRVKGKVTLISNRPMDKKEIYQVFLSILEVHGYSAVPSGEVVKIVPDADAKHSGMPTANKRHPGKGDESVTRVVQIEHVTAAQLVPILRPLVPPQGHLAAYPPSNVLIISDRASNIQRLVKIIKRVDQPSSGEIEYIQLQHATAADLVRVLNTLQQKSAKQSPKASKPMLVADERTNSILIGGDRTARLQLRAIISHLDTPSGSTGDTHVVYLRYAKAKDLVTVLTGIGKAKKKGGKTKVSAATRNQPFDIQADESTNALVITATPSIYRSLESVIRQLDIRRAQVLVEAVIAEVSSDRAAELGVQWLLDGTGSNLPVGAINFGGSGTSISSLAGAALAASSNPLAAVGAIGSGMTVGAGRFNSSIFNFAALVRALEGDGATNILSTPNLVSMDNEEAEIFVGQELSIPSGSFTNTGSTAGSVNPFTTFERKQVGIRLKVKPQINEGNTIRLDIEQNVDGIAAGSAGKSDVVTNQRSITTSVLVDDGAALVLGGLIEDRVVENKQQVPLLGDIPFLGALFRYKSVQKVKINLMVFMRPTILRTREDSLNLTRNKYNFIRGREVELAGEGVGLMSNEEHPTLPHARDYLYIPKPFDGDEGKPSTVDKNSGTKNTGEKSAAATKGTITKGVMTKKGTTKNSAPEAAQPESVAPEETETDHDQSEP